MVVLLLRSRCACSFCHSSVLITASAYLKPDSYGQNHSSGVTNLSLPSCAAQCCVVSPALLAETERLVNMKAYLLLKWRFRIIIHNGRNTFDGCCFSSVTNNVLVSFSLFLGTRMFGPKKNQSRSSDKCLGFTP